MRGFSQPPRLRFSQPPRPLLILRRGTYLPPNPLPTSGGGLTAPPVARSLRYCSLRGGRCDCSRNKVAIILRIKDAIVLFGLPIQNYDNFTRASARWKLKNYGNYGNFCRFSLKNYDYYEYFFQKMITENRPQWSQKNDHREPSPIITFRAPW